MLLLQVLISKLKEKETAFKLKFFEMHVFLMKSPLFLDYYYFNRAKTRHISSTK